jgi:hypothetical protein
MTQIPEMNETQLRQALTAVQLQSSEAQTQLDRARTAHEQVKLQSREAASSLRDSEEKLNCLILQYRFAQDQVDVCREAYRRVNYFAEHVDEQRHLCAGEFESMKIQAAQFDESMARLRSLGKRQRQAAINVLEARSGKTAVSSQFRCSQDALVKALAREEFARQMLEAAGLR